MYTQHIAHKKSAALDPNDFLSHAKKAPAYHEKTTGDIIDEVLKASDDDDKKEEAAEKKAETKAMHLSEQKASAEAEEG